jgi:hypothetical protein
MSTLPVDAALPQLALAMDGPAMAGVFADVLRPHGTQVDGCRVERIKYRPGRNATLGYRLQLRDVSGRAFEQHVAARLCGGQGAARAQRASAGALTASPAGPALRWLPALDLLTWWWPNDPKLHAPRVLACARTLREQVLPALMPALGVPHATDVEIACEVVQYVPEHRLCARVDLRWHEGMRAGAQRVYAKASREPDGATAHGLLAQLQGSAAWRGGRLRTPRALLWHAPTDLYWQEGLPGVPLLDAGSRAMLACAPTLGAQLAALHATPLALERELTAPLLRDRLHDVVRMLSPVLDVDALRRAAQAIDGGWRALDGAATATLHGDFHPRNILIDEPTGTVALIDLDGMRRGPALLELGAWIADAMYRALLDGAPAQRDEAAWLALLDGYVAAGGQRPDPRALRWATAWNLLAQRAWRCVANLKPGRFEQAPRLVALAAALAQHDAAREVIAC